MSKEKSKYDFMAMGQAIKEARLKRGWTREQLAQEVDLAPDTLCPLKTKDSIQAFRFSMIWFLF